MISYYTSFNLLLFKSEILILISLICDTVDVKFFSVVHPKKG